MRTAAARQHRKSIMRSPRVSPRAHGFQAAEAPSARKIIAESLAKRGHPPRLAFRQPILPSIGSAAQYLSREPGVDQFSWTPSFKQRYYLDIQSSASPDNRLVRSLGMENWAPDGQGVVVAVIDSGVVANSNLQSAPKYDFSNGVAKKAAGGDLRFDAYGHGSHIATLIGNTGAADDAPYRGVAAGASGLALKMLDANGAGYTSNVIAAIEFCANKYYSRSTSSICRSGIPSTSRRRSAGPSGRARGPSRHGRDRRGRQSRFPMTQRVKSVRGNYFTGKRAVCHYRRRGRRSRHADTARRRRRALQLAWTNLVRWVRQTRCRRLGASTGRTDRRPQLSLDKLSEQRRFTAGRGSQIPDVERH